MATTPTPHLGRWPQDDAQARQQNRDLARSHIEADTDVAHASKRDIAIWIALWIVGLIALVAISFAAHVYPAFPGDVGITRFIQQLHQPQIAGFINETSQLNWPTPAGIIAIGGILFLLCITHFRAAIAAAIASFGADFANVTLNGWVARPRPHGVQIQVVAHLGLHSFPSGHVTHVIAYYGFLLYLSTVNIRQQPRWHAWLRGMQVVCLYFMIFIGPSRVLEGEHWPSDVLGSYLLGGLMLLLGIGVYHVLPRHWPHALQRRHASPAQQA